LLLVGGHHRWEETGKIFEYLAVGRPILALVHPTGAAADLLRQFSQVRIIDHQDVTGTVAKLEDLLEERTDRGGCLALDLLKRYERRQLTEQLARVLDGCVSPPAT
jgi:hypothetical protein